MKKILKFLLISLTTLIISGNISNTLNSQSSTGGFPPQDVILNGTTLENQHTVANTAKTYADLNNNEDIIIAIIDAIYKCKGIYVFGDSFIVENDQDEKAHQEVGIPVTFDVSAAIGSPVPISGGFKFLDVLVSNAITDVVVPNFSILVNTSETYGQLNSQPDIIIEVVKAIKKIKKIKVTINDFSLSNDQDPKAKQIAKTQILFTAKANAELNIISGNFKFNVFLDSKADISDIKIPPTKITYLPYKTYDDLNKNYQFVNSVIDAIYQKTDFAIGKDEITIDNDQDPKGWQEVGKIVTFTVRGTNQLSRIKGCFSFQTTLLFTKVDISKTDMKFLIIKANPNEDYEKLNSDPTVLKTFIDSINDSLRVKIAIDEITITNDETGKQKAGVYVGFCVVAKPESKQITGSLGYYAQLL